MSKISRGPDDLTDIVQKYYNQIVGALFRTPAYGVKGPWGGSWWRLLQKQSNPRNGTHMLSFEVDASAVLQSDWNRGDKFVTESIRNYLQHHSTLGLTYHDVGVSVLLTEKRGGNGVLLVNLKDLKTAGLRAALVRLAHEQPEMRKHLVPLLRGN